MNSEALIKDVLNFEYPIENNYNLPEDVCKLFQRYSRIFIILGRILKGF